MHNSGFFNLLPLWAIFILTILLVLLSIEVGYRAALLRRRWAAAEKEAPISVLVGAALGLLAFMLTMTFQLAAQRYEIRRQLLIDDADRISTAYLRADFIPDPHRSRMRGLLRDYVQARIDWATTKDHAAAARRSTEINRRLWAEAVAAAPGAQSPVLAGLLIQSVNNIMDLQARREIARDGSRIPGPIWRGLYLLAFIGIGAIGYNGGIAGGGRSPAAVGVAIAFALVICLIADLDRPRAGLIDVSQQPLVDLLQEFAAIQPLPEPPGPAR